MAKETKVKQTPAAKPAVPIAPGRALRVRATSLGYYNEIRRRVGDVFTLASSADFSAKWMTIVPPATRERITTGPEELRRLHDEALAERVPQTGAPDNDPLHN